jgi:hypothetical protein
MRKKVLMMRPAWSFPPKPNSSVSSIMLEACSETNLLVHDCSTVDPLGHGTILRSIMSKNVTCRSNRASYRHGAPFTAWLHGLH